MDFLTCTGAGRLWGQRIWIWCGSYHPTCMSDIDWKVIALAPLGALHTRMAKFFHSSCFWP